MKTLANSLDRTRSQIPANKLGLLSRLKVIWQWMVQVFVGSNELRTWQTYDRYGNNWWHAYDPVTGRYTSVDSEAELRVWIEQHYYR